MLSPCPAVRRGAHCAPAGCRAVVIPLGRILSARHPGFISLRRGRSQTGPPGMSGNGNWGMFRPRASDFLSSQKVTKEPSKGRGISISLSPLKSSLLKTTNQGGCGPPIGCTPREDAPRAVFRIGSSVWYPFSVGAHSVRPPGTGPR